VPELWMLGGEAQWQKQNESKYSMSDHCQSLLAFTGGFNGSRSHPWLGILFFVVVTVALAIFAAWWKNKD